MGDVVQALKQAARPLPGEAGAASGLVEQLGGARKAGGCRGSGAVPSEVEQLAAERLHRAIGVVYRPETERLSHYFYASLSAQFDVVVHLDETHAVEPLDRTSTWDAVASEETNPSGP